MKSDGIHNLLKIEKNLEIHGSMYCVFFNVQFFLFKNHFRSNGFANSLFLSIKSPNAQHYSTIIQGMAKYNQVISIITNVNFFFFSYYIKTCIQFTFIFYDLVIDNKL